MCGRFALTASPEQLEEYFGIGLNGLSVQPRYNIAPSQPILGVRLAPTTNRPEFTYFYWGFLPNGFNPERLPSGWINARIETAGQLPGFRAAFKQRRCLIPITGFFEWQALLQGKQPYFIHHSEKSLFALGGIWEHWQDEQGNTLQRIAILTMQPTFLMSSIHKRMPVVIPKEWFASWLNPRNYYAFKQEKERFKKAGEGLIAYPVGTYVNNVHHDDVNCIKSIE